MRTKNSIEEILARITEIACTMSQAKRLVFAKKILKSLGVTPYVEFVKPLFSQEEIANEKAFLKHVAKNNTPKKTEESFKRFIESFEGVKVMRSNEKNYPLSFAEERALIKLPYKPAHIPEKVIKAAVHATKSK